jgi:hypothetical protein
MKLEEVKNSWSQILCNSDTFQQKRKEQKKWVQTWRKEEETCERENQMLNWISFKYK